MVARRKPVLARICVTFLISSDPGFFLKIKLISFDYHLPLHYVILDKLQTCMREMVGRLNRWKASVRKKTPAKRILVSLRLKNDSNQPNPLVRKHFSPKGIPLKSDWLFL